MRLRKWTEVTVPFLLKQIGTDGNDMAIYMGSYPGATPLSGSSVIERIDIPPDLTYGSYTVSFLKPDHSVDDIGKEEGQLRLPPVLASTITSSSSLAGDDLKKVTGSVTATPTNVTVTAATSKVLGVGDQLWLAITHT